MVDRFEVLPIEDGRCIVRCYNGDERLLLTSTEHDRLMYASASVDWLRSAVHRDWLYRIERGRRHAGPTFSLTAPSGIVYRTPAFSSSDAMERAVLELKRIVPRAPVVLCAAPMDTLASQFVQQRPPRRSIGTQVGRTVSPGNHASAVHHSSTV